MKHRQWLPALGLLAFTAMATPALAIDVVEVEPNNTCGTGAQNAGGVNSNNVLRDISGEIPDDNADVDFYRLRYTTPPSEIQVDLKGSGSGEGTLGDAVLGVYDSTCTQIAVDDDGGAGLDSRLRVAVPANGILYFAASGFPDFDFDGTEPDGKNFGTYVLTVDLPPRPTVIEGVLFDSVPGAPTSGFADLYQCARPDDQVCAVYVDSRFADEFSGGTFSFSSEFLPAGRYQVRGDSLHSNYRIAYSRLISITGGDNEQLGNLTVSPSVIAITEATLTGTHAPGSTASATFTVSNTTAANQTVRVWLEAQSNDNVTGGNFSFFTTGVNGSAAPLAVTLAPGETRQITMGVVIPAQVRRGARIDLFAQASLSSGRLLTVGFSFVGRVVVGTPPAPAVAAAAAVSPAARNKAMQPLEGKSPAQREAILRNR